jgi:hypothetical protein
MRHNASHYLILLITAAVLGCLTLVPASCAARRSQTANLLPAARSAWPAVEEDYARGVSAGVRDQIIEPQVGDDLRDFGIAFEDMLDREDIESIREVPTKTIERWALHGIADQVVADEITPGVAASLIEQVAKFTEVLQRIQEVR